MDVHEFRDGRTRTAEEYSVDGQVRKVQMPPWATRDLDDLRPRVDAFMEQCQIPLEKQICADIDDGLVMQLWKELQRYAEVHDEKLLHDVLKLAAGAMFNSRYPTPAEPDSFEGAQPPITSAYYFEGVPLPPFLTFQIQSMVAEGMQTTQKRILKDVKRRTFKAGKSKHQANWYETFLAVFGLLFTIQLVYRTQIRFRGAHEGVGEKYHGERKCPDGSAKCVSCQMLDEWEEAASVLVKHFRGLMRSEVPFNRSWVGREDNPRLIPLGPEEQAFAARLQEEVERRRAELRSIHADTSEPKYSGQLAFVCELFLGDDRQQPY